MQGFSTTYSCIPWFCICHEPRQVLSFNKSEVDECMNTIFGYHVQVLIKKVFLVEMIGEIFIKNESLFTYLYTVFPYCLLIAWLFPTYFLRYENFCVFAFLELTYLLCFFEFYTCALLIDNVCIGDDCEATIVTSHKVHQIIRRSFNC